MALVDKYGNFNLVMLMAILPGLPIDKLRLVLRFAEFLAKLAKEREVNNE